MILDQDEMFRQIDRFSEWLEEQVGRNVEIRNPAGSFTVYVLGSEAHFPASRPSYKKGTLHAVGQTVTGESLNPRMLGQ